MKLCTESRELDFFCERKIRPAPEPLDRFVDFEFKRGKSATLRPEGQVSSRGAFVSAVLKWASASLCLSFVTSNISESVGKLLAITVYTGWGKSGFAIVPVRNTEFILVVIY